MAKEEAENGERAEENDENIGEQREKTRISISAVVINQGTTDYYYYYQCFASYYLLSSAFSLAVLLVSVVIHLNSEPPRIKF